MLEDTGAHFLQLLVATDVSLHGQYVKTCDPCLQTKIQQCHPIGKLHPLPILEDHWDVISVDRTPANRYWGLIPSTPKSSGHKSANFWCFTSYLLEMGLFLVNFGMRPDKMLKISSHYREVVSHYYKAPEQGLCMLKCPHLMNIIITQCGRIDKILILSFSLLKPILPINIPFTTSLEAPLVSRCRHLNKSIHNLDNFSLKGCNPI
jgi:hypothetical protein